MNKIVLATANPNKVKEIQEIVGDKYQFLSLEDIGCTEDVPETSDTILGNALQKARYVHEKYKIDCLAEDTGLEVDALNGEPGVYTARYAGEQRSPDDNMSKLLAKLDGNTHRAARFRTVVALILDGKEYTFEGIAEGNIAEEKSGAKGFGYDPIFLPDGFSQTFAELDSIVKNKISHRGKAISKVLEFFNTK